MAGLVHAAGTITGVGLLPRLYEGYDVGLFDIAANVIIGLVLIAATRARLGLPTVRAAKARATKRMTSLRGRCPVR